MPRYLTIIKRFFSKNKAVVYFLIPLGLILKLSLFPVATGDYIHFLEPWVDFIKANGYFSALKYDFYNYTPAYLYLLVGIAKTGFNSLYAIKVLSVLFEYIAAYFVGRIAYMKYKDKRVIWAAMAIIPLLPSVLLNSSYLSQCDSIYAAFAVGSIYFALKDRPWLSVLFLGFSFAFKMQAVMVLPFFFVMMLRGKIKWFYFLMIPVVYFISIVPAWCAGRPLSELLGIYLSQSEHYRMLTLNFPNLYVWLNNDWYDLIMPIGVGGVCLLTFWSGWILSRRKYDFTFDMWVRLAFAGAIVVPFFLPGMHERYMYVGDVLGVLYFLVMRKNVLLPIGIAAVSAYSYIRCSRFEEMLPMWPAFFLYMLIIVMVVADLVQSLKAEKETVSCGRS